MTLSHHRIFITQKPSGKTSYTNRLIDAIRTFTEFSVEELAVTTVYHVQKKLSLDQAQALGQNTLVDPIIESASIENTSPIDSDWIIEVSLKPGLTDNTGKTAQILIEDYLEAKFQERERVVTTTQYHLKGNLTLSEVKQIAREFLANPLIETLSYTQTTSKVGFSPPPNRPNLPILRDPIFPILGHLRSTHSESLPACPKPTFEVAWVGSKPHREVVKEIELDISDESLMALSQERSLALNLREMDAIKQYFSHLDVIETRKKVGLSHKPTDVEIEAIAQTWSEHCKHKIFRSLIDYREGKKRETINNLFDTYIRGATKKLAPRFSWLISVFDDNAGIIRFNDRYFLACKVETHNTPSALDPYGGALTGILGVNRDILGAGKGARLLANTDVFCLAPPNYNQKLPPMLLHPKRILEGVRRGVEHGGNKSGVPTVNGALLFDERYLGKPLVYCGTVGMMPAQIDGVSTSIKKIFPGDRIIIAGGRTGRDGIHGATFSSETLNSQSPSSVVQIGDPFTQKKVADFIIEARDQNLFRTLTDNGAGGFSSSIGELAQLSKGCEIHLDHALLKGDEMDPWEILVSESQERMTLAVPEESLKALRLLALKHEVEIVDIGQFTDTGMFHAFYQEKTVAFLSLSFLHDGGPQMEYLATFNPQPETPFSLPKNSLRSDIHQILSRYNICSKEVIVRQYDHEVQGGTVLKPLQGEKEEGPSDAAVILPRETWDEKLGIVLANGICPKWSDFDAYHMAANAIDEAIRNAVAVGCDPNTIALLDNFCWPDPTSDPHKMGQLVRAVKALHDYAIAFETPIISGKDSMKNDYKDGEIEISIPPTLLISALGKIPNISKAVSMDVKCSKDLIYVIGLTKKEMGGSEYANMHGLKGGIVPKVNAQQAKTVYKKVYCAIEKGWIASCHDCSDGGLAVALIESACAGGFGMEIHLKSVPTQEIEEEKEMLFSESASRFIITIDPKWKREFEALFSSIPLGCIGKTTSSSQLIVHSLTNEIILQEDLDTLKESWQKRLREELK